MPKPDICQLIKLEDSQSMYKYSCGLCRPNHLRLFLSAVVWWGQDNAKNSNVTEEFILGDAWCSTLTENTPLLFKDVEREK